MSTKLPPEKKEKKLGIIPAFLTMALVAAGGICADLTLNDGNGTAVLRNKLADVIKAGPEQSAVPAKSDAGQQALPDPGGEKASSDGKALPAGNSPADVAAGADGRQPDAAPADLQAATSGQPASPSAVQAGVGQVQESGQQATQAGSAGATPQEQAATANGEFSAAIVHAPRPREKDPEDLRNERIQSTLDEIQKQNSSQDARGAEHSGVANAAANGQGNARGEGAVAQAAAGAAGTADAAASPAGGNAGGEGQANFSSSSPELQSGSLQGAAPSQTASAGRQGTQQRAAAGASGAARAAHGKIRRQSARDMADSRPLDEAAGTGSGAYQGRIHIAPAPEETRDDPVVTRAYLHEAAKWLVDGYSPSQYGQGKTSLTLDRVNVRSGETPTLRGESSDPSKKRGSVLRHVLSPGMLTALSVLYSDSFLDEMDSVARQTRTGMTARQRGDMFSVYGQWLKKVSTSLEAAANVDVASYADEIQSQSRQEAQCNREFSRAYSARARALSRGRQADVSAYDKAMRESSLRAGYHASMMESKRNELGRAIARNATGETLSRQELTYLGEWLARRNASPDLVRAAAETCAQLAEKFFGKASATADD